MGAFAIWLENSAINVGRHTAILFSERPDARKTIEGMLREVFRDHYMSKETWEQRINELGDVETAKVLHDMLPKTQTARSGDAGEILAVEIAERHLQYRVPIRKLRWKDGRESALRGDDLVAISEDSDGRLQFLKGESKSRVNLSRGVIEEAGEALEGDEGRPSRHSVYFIADRLRELGEGVLALRLERAVLQSFSGHEVSHLLFVLSGNDPTNLLESNLRDLNDNHHQRYAVGVRIDDHGDFIAEIYEGI